MYRYVKLKNKNAYYQKKAGNFAAACQKTFTFKFIEDILFQKKFR